MLVILGIVSSCTDLVAPLGEHKGTPTRMFVSIGLYAGVKYEPINVN